jgi:hypothetical protein
MVERRLVVVPVIAGLAVVPRGANRRCVGVSGVGPRVVRVRLHVPRRTPIAVPVGVAAPAAVVAVMREAVRPVRILVPIVLPVVAVGGGWWRSQDEGGAEEGRCGCEAGAADTGRGMHGPKASLVGTILS